MHPARESWAHRIALRAVTRQKITEECERLTDRTRRDLRRIPMICGSPKAQVWTAHAT